MSKWRHFAGFSIVRENLFMEIKCQCGAALFLFSGDNPSKCTCGKKYRISYEVEEAPDDADGK